LGASIIELKDTKAYLAELLTPHAKQLDIEDFLAIAKQIAE